MQKFKVAQIYPKVDPKSSQSSVYFKVMSFSKAQIVTKYLGYFCKKICYQEFSKIAPIWSHCLDSTKQINMLLFNITKAAESKQEKQDVSCTVIFPPMKQISEFSMMRLYHQQYKTLFYNVHFSSNHLNLTCAGQIKKKWTQSKGQQIEQHKTVIDKLLTVTISFSCFFKYLISTQFMLD